MTRAWDAWDEHADVVVVGFGGAGACATIEAAAAGAGVLVLDRFTGGGTTALSGGVVYAGGGTSVQRAAGVSDSVPAMYDYLSREAGPAVSAGTLKEFCESSAEMIDWLAGHGVPFDPSPCPSRRPTRPTSTTCTTRAARPPGRSDRSPSPRREATGHTLPARPAGPCTRRCPPRPGRPPRRSASAPEHGRCGWWSSPAG